MRTERDHIGEKELPFDALYGIHSIRAAENFPDRTPFHKEWYSATGIVKLAVYRTVLAFRKAVLKNFGAKALPSGLEQADIFEQLEQAAAELSIGKYFEHFIVPAVQGGAGTSINMNVNEILTNAALTNMGLSPGNYSRIHPLMHANIFQSTNDVVPTALKLAVMQLLERLEEVINALRSVVEGKEGMYRNELRQAYTQMQEALPSSWGMLFGAYSEALARDWWRVSKCFERIKIVNLGGGATGSGLAIPRFYVMEVLPQLQKLTTFPLTRSENLSDATQNLDALVEVHAILKAHAVNLEKIASDIRLLASDIGGKPTINIPQKQIGSSIMPGKVNPVIPEFIISSAHKVYSNDMLVSSLCGQGCLDLNAYLPMIGHTMIDSLKILIAAGETLKKNLFDEITVNTETATGALMKSPSITTSLIPYIGYEKASEMALFMKENKCDVFEANRNLKILENTKIQIILKPENLLKLGYSLKNKP